MFKNRALILSMFVRMRYKSILTNRNYFDNPKSKSKKKDLHKSLLNNHKFIFLRNIPKPISPQLTIET